MSERTDVNALAKGFFFYYPLACYSVFYLFSSDNYFSAYLLFMDALSEIGFEWLFVLSCLVFSVSTCGKLFVLI